MGPSKKIVVTTTVDLDELDEPLGDISENAAAHARELANDRRLMVRTNRGRILCREIAPRTFLGLTSERRRLSILQIDENVFIFAPQRMGRQRLEQLIHNLLTRYGIGAAPTDEPSFTDFSGPTPLA